MYSRGRNNRHAMVARIAGLVVRSINLSHPAILSRIVRRISAPRFTDHALEFYWPVGLGFAALCFAVSYPGRLNQDSLYAVITTTSLGELGNWHSATLGWLWSLPGALLGQPAGALLVQSLLLGLFAGFLPRV